MIGYKGFRQDLSCDLGNGRFQYKPGVWYEEKEANCQKNGFHFCENPLDVLHFYRPPRSRYFLVEADGDINEKDDKVSCTRIRLAKELDLKRFLAHAAAFMQRHPDRTSSSMVDWEKGEGNLYVIVRGKQPRAKVSSKGGVILLVREMKDSCMIRDVRILEADDETFHPGHWYNISGREVKG